MFGLISVPIARITSEPSKKCPLDDEALYGTYVDILDMTIGYYLVKTFYNYIGYVNKSDVSVIDTKINHFLTYNGVITKHYVDVQKEPKVESYPLISIPRGSYLKIIPEKIVNGYQSVELINNQKGYIKADCFKYRQLPDFTNEEEIRKRIIDNAMLYLKTQYRWGGKTIIGIDCSGLTAISYLLEELIICRDAMFNDEILTQFHTKTITKEELKPADLIYSPGHIMLYLGNNKYIHSSASTTGVTINSLDEEDPTYLEKYGNHILGYGTIF